MPSVADPREYSRGYVPHRNVPGARQFITWRLDDALDADVWEAWKRQYYRPEDKPTLYRVAERRLDEHRGKAYFRNVAAGAVVMRTLLDKQSVGYELLTAVVMPNHVHAVVRIPSELELAEVVRRMKGASARAANAFLGRGGRLWQPNYFDRVIRSDEQFARVQNYIHWNPVKAGLCTDPKRYLNSTLHPALLRTEVRGPDAD
jgi:REP element-mobilizing transposase RayT